MIKAGMEIFRMAGPGTLESELRSDYSAAVGRAGSKTPDGPKRWHAPITEVTIQLGFTDGCDEMRSRPLIPWLLVAILVSPLASSADTPFEEGRRHGLLIAATIVPRLWVETIADECAKREPATSDDGKRTLKEWADRNKQDFETIDKLLQEYRVIFEREATSQQVDKLRQTTARTVHDTAEPQAREVISQILDTYPRAETTIGCSKMFRAVHQGKYDVRTKQPSAYQLIEEYRARP